MTLNLPNGSCLRCGAKIQASSVELHPSKKDTAIQNFECEKCEFVRSVVYSLKPENKNTETK